jgi:hypothetical protein
MQSRLGRFVALVVGVACLFVVSAGMASASSRVFHIVGPFADEATCAQQSAANNFPPSEITGTCHFYSSNPYPGSGGGTGPGWYYFDWIYLI